MEHISVLCKVVKVDLGCEIPNELGWTTAKMLGRSRSEPKPEWLNFRFVAWIVIYMFRDLVKDIQFQNVIFFNFFRLKLFGMIGVFSC